MLSKPKPKAGDLVVCVRGKAGNPRIIKDELYRVDKAYNDPVGIPMLRLRRYGDFESRPVTFRADRFKVYADKEGK